MRTLRLLLLFLIATISFTSCKTIRIGKNIQVPKRNIIFKSQGFDDEQWINKINEVFDSEFTIRKCSCGDTDLRMIDFGENSSLGDLLTGLGNMKGPGNGNVDGSPNYLIKIPYKKRDIPRLRGLRKRSIDIRDFLSEDDDASVIAILDSGIDLTNRFNGEKILYKNILDDSCPESISGWNFVDGNSNIQDHPSSSHGTYVTKIIVNELRSGTSPPSFQILPLKIANANNKVSYWDLLCAMSYVKQVQSQTNKIKVVNSSFGFEIGSQTLFPGIGLSIDKFKEHMGIYREYISDLVSNTAITASAGNKGSNIDSTNGSLYLPAELTNENLITIGGYSFPQYLKHEDSNFGNLSVDVAYPYEFRIFQKTIKGTSFSTALGTAEFYRFLLSNNITNRITGKSLWLGTLPEKNELKPFYKDGKYSPQQ